MYVFIYLLQLNEVQLLEVLGIHILELGKELDSWSGLVYPSLQTSIEMYLFARHHIKCRRQYKDVETRIPPFTEH